MKAIVRSGSRQYIAEEGKTILVERLPDAVGAQVTFNEVLMVATGDQTQVGKPFVSGASVLGTIVDQMKGEKLRVFHYQPKKRVRKMAGHRQQYTRVRVDKISL